MEKKDYFTEYKLEWFEKDKLDEMIHDKLTKLLSYVRREGIKKYTIKSKVWLYSGQAAWHFIGIPKKESEEIKKAQKDRKSVV